VTLRAICKYFVICGKECIHAVPHIPLYKSRYSTVHVLSAYKRNNCATYPSKLNCCPPEIPPDRECMDINAEEIANRMANKVKNGA